MGLEQVKDRFWDRSESYGVQAPLTEAMVEDAEATLGLRLPADFLTLLRVQNGGSPVAEFDAYPLPDPEGYAPFEDVAGVGQGREALTILDSPYLTKEWEMPKELVLLSGDGHTWIALDYRGCGPEGQPSLTWFDNEMEFEVALAPSFRSFVEGLRPSESFD